MERVSSTFDTLVAYLDKICHTKEHNRLKTNEDVFEVIEVLIRMNVDFKLQCSSNPDTSILDFTVEKVHFTVICENSERRKIDVLLAFSEFLVSKGHGIVLDKTMTVTCLDDTDVQLVYDELSNKLKLYLREETYEVENFEQAKKLVDKYL